MSNLKQSHYLRQFCAELVTFCLGLFLVCLSVLLSWANLLVAWWWIFNFNEPKNTLYVTWICPTLVFYSARTVFKIFGDCDLYLGYRRSKAMVATECLGCTAPEIRCFTLKFYDLDLQPFKNIPRSKVIVPIQNDDLFPIRPKLRPTLYLSPFSRLVRKSCDLQYIWDGWRSPKVNGHGGNSKPAECDIFSSVLHVGRDKLSDKQMY